MRIGKNFFSIWVTFVILAASFQMGAAETIQLKSAGPMTFGPKGVLFVSDPMGAEIHAFETGETASSEKRKKITVDRIDQKIAAMMGSKAGEVSITDLAVSPATGNAYLSVARRVNGKTEVAIFKVLAGDENSKVELVDLDQLKSTTAKIADAPKDARTRRGNQRMSTVTDLMFIDGELYVAGLSNEEFASSLRAIPFPFEKEKGKSSTSSIEIYHGAHGRFETRSPIRTFAAYDIAGETNVLAAYTCTPLVRIPVTSLKPKTKVKGTTVAELGNRNRPLDMVVYKKDGKDYVLMANSSRGVMKIALGEIKNQVAITSRVSGGKTEGIQYDTIKELQGVMQLDRVNDKLAMLIVKTDEGYQLKTIDLP